MDKLNEEQKELLRITISNLVKINNEILPIIDNIEDSNLKDETEEISVLLHKILKEVKNDL